MNAGLLPLALLASALGLAMYATPIKTAWVSVGIFAAASVIAWMVTQHYQYGTLMLLGFWVITALTAALVYLPQGLTAFWAALASANAGIWLGAFANSAGGGRSIAWALPLSLLFLPGAWLLKQGIGIGVKIVASWIFAVCLLAGMVSMTATPGYAPDHME